VIVLNSITGYGITMPIKGDNNTIEVTGLEEKILRFIEENAMDNKKVSVNDVSSNLKLSKSSVYAALYGRKGISNGLFKKLPAIKTWILMIRRKKKAQYDVSFFLDHEAGFAQKRVNTKFEE